MKYQIIYDRPGRLRVRFGKYAFDRAQARGIRQVLLAQEGILSVETAPANGGVLIQYRGACRKAVLSALDGLRRSSLPAVEADEAEKMRQANMAFVQKVTGMVFRHYALKLILPNPLRNIRTVLRSSKYIYRGLHSLLKGQLNVSVLDMSSLLCAFAQGMPDTVSSIMLLLDISEALEDHTRRQTIGALTDSLSLQVDSVWLVTEDGDVQVPMSSVQPGDVIRVRAGSMIPVDGTVCHGEAAVNESSMTGEPLAVHRKEGDSVYAGTCVEEGSIRIEVRKKPGESRINSIVEMIDQSENLKAGIQSKAEKLADSIVPYSFATALLTLAISRNPLKAMSVLMVDYSCALKLSIPIAVVSGMREAVDHRILVKGGKFLEGFAEADAIIFDKTGTLTSAQPRVTKVLSFEEYSREQVLRDAACLEEHFPHSVAKAIVKQAELENLKHKEEHAKVIYIVAHGINTILRDQTAQIGSAHFIFEDQQVPLSEEDKAYIDREMQGLSRIYLAVNGRLKGVIGIEDPVRPDAPALVQHLLDNGFAHVIMMTGDGAEAAERAAGQLGIGEYFAQVLPEDKAAMIEHLKADGHKVVMIGDGINDSPALAAADVSVSLRDSSDLAKQVADITLLSENLWDLVTLRKLSKRLIRRIHMNYGMIISINSLLIGLGIAGVMGPGTTSVLHNISTMAISTMSTRNYLNSNDIQEYQTIEQ